MKIRIVSANVALIAAIRESFEDAEVLTGVDSAGLAEAQCNVLIIDGMAISLNAVADKLSEVTARVVYLANRNEQDVSHQGVMVLKYEGRLSVITDELKKFIKSLDVHRNVIVFWSPVSGSGTTTTALTVMKQIPANYRTLFMSLTDVPGIEYMGRVEGSITDILPRLMSGVLDVHDLVAGCTMIGNSYYLGGLTSYVDVPTYTVEHIKALIALAAGYFDYVVADAGFGASLMAIAAFSVAAHAYVVTTPAMTAAVRYEQLMRQVYGSVPEIVMERLRLITNMDDKDLLINRTAKAYGLKSAGALRAVEQSVGVRAGYEGELIYNIDMAGYRRDMDALLGEIYAEIGVAQGDAKRTAVRRGLLGLFGGKT